METDITPYIEVRDKLCTFTAINCISRKWPYRWIGHTAILYKDPLTGQLMIFESTTLNKFTGISGVQMMPFGAWLARYDGKVFARIPEFEDNSLGKQGCRDVMAADFIRENLGTSYPNLKTMTGRFKLYMASLDFELFGMDLFEYHGDDDGIFCTELFIKMLQKCGLFQAYKYACEFKPRDTRGNDEMFERMLCGMTYGKEIQLK